MGNEVWGGNSVVVAEPDLMTSLVAGRGRTQQENVGFEVSGGINGNSATVSLNGNVLLAFFLNLSSNISGMPTGGSLHSHPAQIAFPQYIVSISISLGGLSRFPLAVRRWRSNPPYSRAMQIEH